ncbi:Tim17-domain-containing protein [Lactarius hengduanensis]|nr:Tim17-domain-containing protein [Lactarius hengduanensis]
MSLPLVAPLFPAGKEPLPPGMTEEDRPNLLQAKKYQGYMTAAMESWYALPLGGFFSMMSTSFAYEDPLLRQNLGTTQKKQSGKGFAKVGALFAGIECVIESYRARNDMVNPVAAGFLLGGGSSFCCFSAAIDLFLRRETR